jgi:putative tryptophan/tyrosine transport system substrate-binding protein
MKRREFIAGLGSVAAWPVAAAAQQAMMPVIGLLNGATSEAYAGWIAAIRRGLQDAGFVEGRNLSIEVRAAGQYERLPALAADLVHRQVAVIIAIGGLTAALAAKAATSTIPIVFAMGADAVEIGLVKSLNRPEANVTGASFASSGPLAPKRLERILEMVPHATVIGYLDNQVNASFELYTRNIATASQSKGREIVPFGASAEQEIDTAFADMQRRRIDALIVSADAFFHARNRSSRWQHGMGCRRSILGANLSWQGA